jgi:WD40 repeat protein
MKEPKMRREKRPNSSAGLLIAVLLLSACANPATAQPKVRAAIDTGLDGALSLAYSPDGKTLATVSASNSIILWSMTTGKKIGAISLEQADEMRSVAYSPDGKTLVAWGEKSIKLWSATTGKPTGTLKGHAGPVHAVVYNPDSKTLASASDDKIIKLWDAATGKNTATFKGHTDAVLSLSYSRDGKTLASSGKAGDGSIRL